MIIDAHNHPDWHGVNLDRFLQNMEENRIDVTWLLSWEAPQGEWDPHQAHLMPESGPNGPIPFARCLSYKERAPEKFVLGYAPDPRRPDAIDRLLAAKEIYGVKVCGELKLRMMLDDWDAIRLFRVCGEQGLPVVVHLDNEKPTATGRKYPRPNWWYGGGMDAFGRALEACPETVFLGHAPAFWGYISGDDKAETESYPKGPVLPGGKLVHFMERYENLYCDISAGSGHNALSRDLDFTREFLTTYQDRVLYGRDYFDNRHQELLNSLNLPQEVLDKIYYKNALKLAPLN